MAGLPQLSERLAEFLVVHVQVLANVGAAKRSTLAFNQVEHALTKRWGVRPPDGGGGFEAWGSAPKSGH